MHCSTFYIAGNIRYKSKYELLNVIFHNQDCEAFSNADMKNARMK